MDISHSKLDISGITVSRLSFSVDGVNIGITAAYKPPPIPVRDFVVDLHAFLETNISNHIEVFTGDINIDILKANDNNVCDYLYTMAQLGFIPYINSPTRFQTNTCLDHIFVRQKLRTVKCRYDTFILDTHVTDHSPVMLNITSDSLLPNHVSQESHIMKKTKLDLNKFRQLLSMEDWSCVTSLKDPDLATDVFVTTFMKFVEMAEVEYIVRVGKYKKIKRWITNGLITSIKCRDRMKKQLLKNYNPELDIEYKAYRNYLNRLICKRKNDYYRNEINKNKNNVKKVYDIIRDATNECSRKKSLICICNDSNEKFESEVEMANYCNDYFVNIGVKMNEQVPLPREPCGFDIQMSRSSLFLKPLTEAEIISHISSLKNNSASGHDRVSVGIIKYSHAEILKPLLHIINLCFEVGCVPSQFKTSIVVPVHKSGSKADVGNYRPISLISNFAKIFEKSLKIRLVNHFKANNIISSHQYGFTEGLSTGDAMYRLVSEITSNLNLGKKCIGVFLDLAKAFDTVPHKKMLEVLSCCGLRGVVLQLMESYLRDRYQLLRLNNSFSNKQRIRVGIPQGTVIGPILFIVYINSLLMMDIGGMTLSYADDTAIIFSGKDWEETKLCAEVGLLRVKNWLETYNLTLNLSKTKYIAFSLTNAGRPNFTDLEMGEATISEAHQVKYLGIVVDEFLKWGPHIDYISGKMRRLIHKFYLLREFLTTGILVMVYKSLVESLIRYGIVVWGGLYSSTLYKLEILQKYLLKIIYRKRRTYPTELLFTVNTPNIRVIYMSTLCSFLYNCDRVYINHSYETRKKVNKHLKIPMSNNNLNLKFTDYIAPKIYNLLPNAIKNLTNLRKFNTECKKFIFENYYSLFKDIVK